MKHLFFSLLVLLSMITGYSQSVVYVFYFDEVWVGDRGEPNSKPGTGKITVYDNLSIVYEGRSSTFGNFRTEFNIQTASTTFDTWFNVYSGSDKDNCQWITFFTDATNTFYFDKRNPNNEITYSLSTTNKSRNASQMNAMLLAFNNRTGIFSSFRSQSDIELPLKIEGRTSNYSVRANAGGDEIAYSVRTKTGKMIDETVFEDYEVSSDSYWADVSFHTEAAFLLKTQPNTTGSTRTATISINAKGSDIVTKMTVTQPSMVAKVNRVWVEHNKRKGLVKGMKIHVEFETFNVRGVFGYCNAYFWFANGNKLFDYNGYYRATDGQVCCSGSFNSPYDSTIYHDFELFMPYNELHINGSADCYFMVEVQVAGQSAASEKISFNVY